MREISLIFKPLSWVYGLVLWIRHFLYDSGFFASKNYDIPIIKIGNLALGGTGKTPFTIFLAKILSENFHECIISRGYGRKTRGFRYVSNQDDAKQVGDEPLMMRRALTSGTIVVSESRTEAIDILRTEMKENCVFILDDALQHRRVGSGLQILLTKSDRLFYLDHLFPYGRLRDLKSRARCADIIVVTNTTEQISKEEIRHNIKQYSDAKVIFSRIKYLPYRNYMDGTEFKTEGIMNTILVSAIASTDALKRQISLSFHIVEEFSYRDHYSFQLFDIQNWINASLNSKAIILTTEKDAVKLDQYRTQFEANKVNIVILPIEIELIEESKPIFLSALDHYLTSFISRS